MPAAFTFSGVLKSGSPAPKSTTSTPARRRRSASAATASVADPVMFDSRSASIDAPRFLQHPCLHRRGYQASHFPAKTKDLLDQAGAQIRILLGGHHEHGLERRLEMPVHQRHLELVL